MMSVMLSMIFSFFSVYGGNLATLATANVMYEYSSVCAGVTHINVQVEKRVIITMKLPLSA